MRFALDRLLTQLDIRLRRSICCAVAQRGICNAFGVDARRERQNFSYHLTSGICFDRIGLQDNNFGMSRKKDERFSKHRE